MAQDPLCLLCVEPSFPGRLGAVTDWLVRTRGYRCWFASNRISPREFWPESVGRGLELLQYEVGGVAWEPSVPWTRSLERWFCHAHGVWELLEAQRPRPVDVVPARSSGLGSTLFVPGFDTRVPLVNLFDGYLHPRRNDLAEEVADGVASEPNMLREFDRDVSISNMIMRMKNDVICVVAGGGQVRRGLDLEHYGIDDAAVLLE
ncbi:glycosyltransferase family protein [Tautonia rosea]|uniref:hypothetical protein n=1 Tax=Tautonia rosea TaxID=2728037 RepID=UPI001473F592|nr:hypothetical protein [Tautonia rosea]